MFNYNENSEKKQNDILQSIELNQFDYFVSLFSDYEFDISFSKNVLIKKIALYNRTDMFRFVFFNDRSNEIEFDIEHNYCIRYFSENGNFECVNLLLSLSNTDASDFRNLAIRNAFENNHFNIVDLLWEIKEVKNTLEEIDKKLFDHLTHKKTINNVKNF